MSYSIVCYQLAGQGALCLLPSLRDPDGAASISKVINYYESESG